MTLQEKLDLFLKEQLLSQKEADALRRLGVERLSPTAAAQYFALFLNGYSCEQIFAQNPTMGGLGLGLLVRARLEYDWDKQRQEYMDELHANVKTTTAKVALEAVQFANDGMSAFHKLVGDRLRKYLQSGDETNLEGHGLLLTFKTYKDFVNIISKIRSAKQPFGGEAQDSPAPQEAVENPVQGTTPVVVEVKKEEERKLTALEAMEALASWAEEKN